MAPRKFVCVTTLIARPYQPLQCLQGRYQKGEFPFGFGQRLPSVGNLGSAIEPIGRFGFDSAGQAEGNVQDNTNLQVVSFEYGLPTATQIWGGTLELQEVLGFDLYSEYDLSYSYTKYPNVSIDASEKDHSTWSGIKGDRAAPAWMLNLSRIDYPWFVFAEAYSMDPRYNTRTFTALSSGFIDYEDERAHVFELVEDNDDQDQFRYGP